MQVTEREVESVIDIQLVAGGWQLNARKPGRNVYKQQARTKEQNSKLERSKPDYVLYADEDSNKPTMVIEAKKPGQSMSDALHQGIEKYAKKIGAPIVVATDGWRVKTWHIHHNAPLLIDGHEVDELFGTEMAQHFIREHNFNSFSKEAGIATDELIGKFRQANKVLKDEGLSAGIDRFSEFANLMFLKLQMEGIGMSREIAGFSWADIERKQGAGLLDAVKSMLSELGGSTAHYLDQTKIKHPGSMEKLIEILSSFRLSSVKSDIKGIAFEHFIHSYTRGTKNDLGQYFTPRHIVRMMVHFLKPKITETVYDPFCGTGGMLIECFRYINQHIQDAHEKAILKEKTLYGRDNSDVARIAIMNMIMFGDGHSNITRGDSYKAINETRNQYDVVITNIPFSQQTDFAELYPIPPQGTKNGDSIAVQHCLESLKDTPTARAAIIVPIGFLHKSQLANERRHIFDNWNVERIIELSPKCFQPYTEQQTAVLFINRALARKSYFPYYRVANDGYSQDGYRVPIPGENDIDRTMDDKGAEEFPIDSSGDARFKTINLVAQRGEVLLGEVAHVIGGAANISPKTKTEDVYKGVHPVMMVADLAKNHINYCLTDSAYKLTNQAVETKNPHLFPKHTVLIPTCGKAALKNHRALLGIAAYITSTLTGVVAKDDKIHPFCLFYFFLNFDVDSIVYDLGYPGITANLLQSVPIPKYSAAKQRGIVKQIGEAINLSEQLREKHNKIIGADL